MSISAHQPAAMPEPAPPELAEVVAAVNRLETDGAAELAVLHERHPRCPEILGHLIHALSRRAEHERAIAMCERLLELTPGDIHARLTIADRLVNLERLDEADEIYRGIHSDHPDCDSAVAGNRYVAHLRRRNRSPESGRDPNPLERTGRTEQQIQNQEINRSECASGRCRLSSLPTHLLIEGTTRCNFYCQTCSKGHGAYYAEELHDEAFDRVRREIIPTSMIVGITGFGEPTIGERFGDLVDSSCAHGCSVELTTNGTGLGIDRIEQMIRNKAQVTLSVDGSTRETFERVRLGGDFDRAIERMAMIQRLRRIHADQPLSDWRINFVCLRSNIHELPGVIRIAHRYGINRVNALDYMLGWNEFDAESLRNEPALGRIWFAEARAVADELGVELALPPMHDESSLPTVPRTLWQKVRSAGHLFPKRGRFPRRCPSPWQSTYITTDGRVLACCLWTQSLGSLRKRSFESVWNGWRYRLLRWRIHTVFPPIPCRNCHLECGINGGNAGNAIAKEGLIIKGLYRLEIAARRLARGLARRIARILRLSHPEPEPNYHRGRPIGVSNRSERSSG